MFECECFQWVDNIKKIDKMFGIAHVHGESYKGEIFVYCPWCGEKLEEIKNEN
jgi:predicted  nucleic acid-binding Zn ribbon protein